MMINLNAVAASDTELTDVKQRKSEIITEIKELFDFLEMEEEEMETAANILVKSKQDLKHFTPEDIQKISLNSAHCIFELGYNSTDIGDKELQKELLRVSALAGHANALGEYAGLFYEENTPESKEEALKWYAKAAAAGREESYNFLLELEQKGNPHAKLLLEENNYFPRYGRFEDDEGEESSHEDDEMSQSEHSEDEFSEDEGSEGED